MDEVQIPSDKVINAKIFPLMTDEDDNQIKRVLCVHLPSKIFTPAGIYERIHAGVDPS